MKNKAFPFEADVMIFESDGSAESWPSIDISVDGINVYCESELSDGDELMVGFDDSANQEHKDVLVNKQKDNLYYLKFVESFELYDLKLLISKCHGKSQTASMLPDFKKK
ncbi:MAG: hypothetical protein HYU69_05115 [Bacteroidetes bacterium]|nr:hypothetical protein [Bacteroidota bacterium]